MSSLLRALTVLPFCMPLCTQAHMQMSSPYPLRSALDPSVPEQYKDYSMTTPLNSDGSGFSCKHHQYDDMNPQAYDVKATYQAGSPYQLTLAGSATHEGGSCQISISYDNGASFKVIQSLIGGCPLDTTLNFTIPSFAPSSNSALLSWTWFNLVGNREMYQNCARVQIQGTPLQRYRRTAYRRQSSMDQLPDMFVCNVANGCQTVENAEVVFPDPGPNVVYGQDAVTPNSGPGFIITGSNSASTASTLGSTSTTSDLVSTSTTSTLDATSTRTDLASTSTTSSSDSTSTTSGLVSTSTSSSLDSSSTTLNLASTSTTSSSASTSMTTSLASTSSLTTARSSVPFPVSNSTLPTGPIVTGISDLTTTALTTSSSPSFSTTPTTVTPSATAQQFEPVTVTITVTVTATPGGSPTTMLSTIVTSIALTFPSTASSTSLLARDTTATSSATTFTTLTIALPSPSSSSSTPLPSSSPSSCTPGTITCNSPTTFSQCISSSGTYIYMGSVAAGTQCSNGQIIRQNAGPCTPNGQTFCNGSSAFYLCDQGGLIDMGLLAAGTVCRDGVIVAA